MTDFSDTWSEQLRSMDNGCFHEANIQDGEKGCGVNRGRIPRKTWCMRPYAGADYNIAPLQNQLQQIYHGQPYTTVGLNPVPESTLSPSQGLWIWPQSAAPPPPPPYFPDDP